MKVAELHEMLKPLTPEVRKRVIHQLAVRQAMLKAGITTADLRKKRENEKKEDKEGEKGKEE